MNEEALAALTSEPVMTRSLPESPVSVDRIREAGWTFDDLWLPAVTLDRTILDHNLTRFAAWVADQGGDTAPHGKTTMAPQLWHDQIKHGAWGITVANIQQARVAQQFGVRNVLIANEVADPAQIAWLGAHTGPDFCPYVLVDSDTAIDTLESHLGGASLNVLVEIGVPGARTGARTADAAVALARRVHASPVLVLAGIEAYEGVFPPNRADESPQRARDWLDHLAEIAATCDAAQLFDGDEIILTAGGSNYPDLVLDALAARPAMSLPVRSVIRSGGYVTHDDLMMERSSPLRAEATDDPLLPALTGWARIMSNPEPGLAFASIGKRDVPYDIDLPIVRALWRDGVRVALSGSVVVTKLNDQHAFLADTGEGDQQVRIGDVLELGLSHPCTAFDKWNLIPVLDADRRVIDAVRTLF